MNVVIIGGTGFIGQHLVNMLIKNDHVNHIRLLSRSNKKIDFMESDKLKLVCGDIFSPASLSELIVEGAIVVNLAFLADSSQKKNLDLISNILAACKTEKAQKLIHCSTAVVCGRALESLITEATSCEPYSKYEQTKLQIEKLILDQKDLCFDTIILRPTAVFGANGKNLLQLANDLYFGCRLKNYFKSCIYGNRTMNLVPVANVVSSLSFLILYRKSLRGEIYIIADDECEQNNYIRLEKEFMHLFGIKDYIIPRVFMPNFVLKLILRLLRKSNIDPERRYSSNKLVKLGWSNSTVFISEVKDFAAWFKEKARQEKITMK